MGNRGLGFASARADAAHHRLAACRPVVGDRIGVPDRRNGSIGVGLGARMDGRQRLARIDRCSNGNQAGYADRMVDDIVGTGAAAPEAHDREADDLVAAIARLSGVRAVDDRLRLER